MPSYRTLRTTAQQAPWQDAVMGGVPDEDSTPRPMMPDRAPAVVRTAVLAFTALLSCTPREAPANTSLPAPQSISQPASSSARNSRAAVSWQRMGGAILDAPSSGTWPETDTFTDSAGTSLSSHVPDTGGAWVLDSALPGNAVITVNQRLRQDDATGCVWTVDVVPPTPHYTVSCRIYAYSLLNFEFGTGVAARWQGSGNGYVAYYNAKVKTWNLGVVVNGVITQIGDPYSQTISLGTNYVLALSVNGTGISLSVDGVTLISGTDSTYTTAGFAGIYFGVESGSISTDSTGVHLDDYTTGTIPQLPISPVSICLPDPIRRTVLPTSIAVRSPLDQGTATQTPIVPTPLATPRSSRGASYQSFGVQPPLDAVAVQDPVPGSSVGQPHPGKRMGTAGNWIGQNPVPETVNPGYVGVTGSRIRNSYLFRRLPQIANYGWGVRPQFDQGVQPEKPGSTTIFGGAPPRASIPTPILVAPPRDVVAPSSPISPLLPDRGPAAFRPAPYHLVVIPRPDLGPPQPIVQPAWTNHAPGLCRTANEAYQIALASRPDAGIIGPAPILPSTPSRADGRRTWYGSLQITHASRPDAGLAQPIIRPVFPDHARGPQRTGAAAYQIVLPANQDPGIIFPMPVPALFPSSAPASRRWAAPAQVVVQSPHEPGTQPIIAAQVPDRPRAQQRAAESSYWLNARLPIYSGTSPVGQSLPTRAEGPRRTAHVAYQVNIASRQDVGKRPIAPSIPDRAEKARRSAPAAYLIAQSAPMAPPILPMRRSIPDRAERARRTAGIAYQVLQPAPRDAGRKPLPTLYPDRAPRPRTIPNASFVSRKPLDAGQLPVHGDITTRAQGPRRTASTAYQIVVQAMREAGSRPISALFPDRASGPLARLALRQIVVRSSVDFGILTIKPIFVDPRSAYELYEPTELIELDPGDTVEPDPRAATVLYTSDQMQPDPRFATVVI